MLHGESASRLRGSAACQPILHLASASGNRRWGRRAVSTSPQKNPDGIVVVVMVLVTTSVAWIVMFCLCCGSPAHVGP